MEKAFFYWKDFEALWTWNEEWITFDIPFMRMALFVGSLMAPSLNFWAFFRVIYLMEFPYGLWLSWLKSRYRKRCLVPGPRGRDRRWTGQTVLWGLLLSFYAVFTGPRGLLAEAWLIVSSGGDLVSCQFAQSYTSLLHKPLWFFRVLVPFSWWVWGSLCLW